MQESKRYVYLHRANKTIALPVMVASTLSFDDKVFKAVERLLRTSGHDSWMIVSVVDEANKYCFKKVDGTIGTVSKSYLHDRITDGLY